MVGHLIIPGEIADAAAHAQREDITGTHDKAESGGETGEAAVGGGGAVGPPFGIQTVKIEIRVQVQRPSATTKPTDGDSVGKLALFPCVIEVENEESTPLVGDGIDREADFANQVGEVVLRGGRGGGRRWRTFPGKQ